jgi:hypothetical protein
MLLLPLSVSAEPDITGRTIGLRGDQAATGVAVSGTGRAGGNGMRGLLARSKREMAAMTVSLWAFRHLCVAETSAWPMTRLRTSMFSGDFR